MRRWALFGLVIATLIAGAAAALMYVYPKITAYRDRLAMVEAQLGLLNRNLVDAEVSHQYARGDSGLKATDAVAFAALMNGSWTRIAGEGEHGSWKSGSFRKTKALEVHQDRLCTGFLTIDGTSTEVWCFDGSRWTKIGGAGLNGSWPKGSNIPFLKSFDGALYAGVDSRLWRWDGRAWTDLAGVGDKCTAYSAEIFDGQLYVGSVGCGLRLYRLEGASLVPVASGPAEHSGIYELHVHRGSLYVGTISSYRTAGVFRLDGTTLVKVGGDGVNGSWISPGFYYLESFASFGDTLIVTMNRAPLAPQPFSAVWAFDGTGWKPVGLNRMPAAWGRMMNFNASFVMNGTLLVGGGGVPPGNTSVWALAPDGAFALLGGFGARKSWGAGDGRMRSDSTAEYVYRMKSWRGKLVVGFGDGPGLAQIWLYTPGGS